MNTIACKRHIFHAIEPNTQSSTTRLFGITTGLRPFRDMAMEGMIFTPGASPPTTSEPDLSSSASDMATYQSSLGQASLCCTGVGCSATQNECKQIPAPKACEKQSTSCYANIVKHANIMHRQRAHRYSKGDEYIKISWNKFYALVSSATQMAMVIWPPWPWFYTTKSDLNSFFANDKKKLAFDFNLMGTLHLCCLIENIHNKPFKN